jgi:phosphoribosylglycinamide formyltransferase 2
LKCFRKNGASAVILASENSTNPTFLIRKIAALPKTDFRLFGKPTSRPSAEWAFH